MKGKVIFVLKNLGFGALLGTALSTCIAAGISLDRMLYSRALEKATRKNTREKHDQ